MASTRESSSSSGQASATRMSVMRIANRLLPLLVFFAVPVAAASCRSLIQEAFRPPKVRVAGVVLTSDPRSDPRATWAFLLTLAVDNPNGYPLNVVHVA